MASPAACPGRCADPRVEQAEFVALAAVLGLIDRNLSERATRERVLVRRGGLITEPALHQKARLEPRRRDAVSWMTKRGRCCRAKTTRNRIRPLP